MIYAEHIYILYFHVTVYLGVGTSLLQFNNKTGKRWAKTWSVIKQKYIQTTSK